MFALLNWQFVGAVGPALIAFLLGLIVWHLRPRLKQKVFLPILKIFPPPSKKPHQLIWERPPWWAFWPWVFLGLLLILSSMKPKLKMPKAIATGDIEHHVFIDFSPSGAAENSLEELVDLSLKTLNSLKGQVTYSTSHGPEIKSFDTLKESLIRAEWLGMGFHRAGLRLGPAVRKLQDAMPRKNRKWIFISDGHEGTWESFQWAYLSKEEPVYWQPLAGKILPNSENSFIDRVKSYRERGQIFFEIVLKRNKVQGTLGGRLRLKQNQQELAALDYQFGTGDYELSLKLKLTDSERVRIKEGEPWEWELDTQDALDLDRSFLSLNVENQGDILQVGESHGEQFLEDAGYHLGLSLGALGYKTTHLRRFNAETAAQYLSSSLWILQSDSDAALESYCPSVWAQKRMTWTETEARKLAKIWLIPSHGAADFQGLCHCFAKLAIEKNPLSPLPTYCEDIHTAQSYADVLYSLGAKQIGGKLGQWEDALGFAYRDPKNAATVLALTRSLNPLEGGVRAASLPALLKNLLQVAGPPYEASDANHEWPRIRDISAFWGQSPLENLARSNIPKSVSLLKRMSPQSMPPLFNPDSKTELNYFSEGPEHEYDAQPIVLWLMGLAALVCLVECVLGWYKISKTSTLVGLFALSLGLTKTLNAGVDIVWLKNEPTSGKWEAIAEEVKARTSIALNASGKIFTKLDPKIWAEPWLFVDGRKLSEITDQRGVLLPEARSWLKRGGFLVIENLNKEALIRQLTAAHGLALKAGEGWHLIPAEHELMRSFHLLSALPACPNEVWRGFQFDGRLAIVTLGHSLLQSLEDINKGLACQNGSSGEQNVRTFINLLMVALTTDYKKDQIHLPEILKRLR